MIERYVIQDVLTQGYWSKSHKSFKGLLYAFYFMSESDARNTIVSELPNGGYEILKLYIKE